MANTIKHQGIVENINGSHLSVRIIQTSACAACSVKGHCSSADSKEKVIDVTTGDVTLAFVFPFILLILSLFIFMAVIGDELYASLLSLAVLVPYYCLLWLNKTRLKQTFSFTIKPIK